MIMQIRDKFLSVYILYIHLYIMNTIIDISTDNNILINNKNTNVSVKDLFDEFNKNFRIQQKFNATNFRQLNQMINRADCIKDGTNGFTIQQLDLFGANENSFSLDNLKTLAHDVINYFEENHIILPQNFTRDKKGDDTIKEKYNGLKFDIGFDSGLGVNNFLHKQNYNVICTFGKYIDPSSTRKSNQGYPSKNISLVITERIFDIFGYDNCVINDATYISSDKYDYNIKISGIEMTNNNTSRNNDQNIKTYFVGNKEKNKSNTSVEKKRAMIVGKSLGDKLQVLIMFIKKIQNKMENQIVALSTCDEIVMLFCILLNVPCFYTSIDTEKKIKINKVLYYNLDNTNPQKAAVRFENEKKIVVDGYKNMISLINEIRENNSPLKITGDNRYYTVSSEFLQGMINDLREIQLEIMNISIVNFEDMKGINDLIQQIKNMTINNFIYKSKGNGGASYLITQAKQYTRYNPLGPIKNTAYGKRNLLNNLSIDLKQIDQHIKWSFFEILRKSGNPPKPANILSQGGSKKNSVVGGSKYDIESYRDISMNISTYFDTTEITVFIKEDEIDYSKVNDKNTELVYYNKTSFDANRSLLDTLFMLYIGLKTTVPFEDIYSEMLCLFNSDPNYYTEHLNEQMIVIEKELRSGFTLPIQKSEKQMDISPFTLSNQISEEQMDISPGMVNKSVFRIPSRTRKTLKKPFSQTKRNNDKDIRAVSIKKLKKLLHEFSKKRGIQAYSPNTKPPRTLTIF